MFYHILITWTFLTALIAACSADFSGGGDKFSGGPKKTLEDCMDDPTAECGDLNPFGGVDSNGTINAGGGNADGLGGTIAGGPNNLGGDGGATTGSVVDDATFGSKLISNCKARAVAVIPWTSINPAGKYKNYSASVTTDWLKATYPNWMYLTVAGNGHFSKEPATPSYAATVGIAGITFSHQPDAGYDDSSLIVGRDSKYIRQKGYPNPATNVGTWTALNIPNAISFSANTPEVVTLAPPPEISVTYCQQL